MPNTFKQGDRVHAFSRGVLQEGVYEADIMWEGWSEVHSIIILQCGMRYICRRTSVRATKELPSLNWYPDQTAVKG